METTGPGRGFKIAQLWSKKYKKDNHMLSYFKEVRAEMKHVSWPTRAQAVVYTIVVVVVSLATAFYLGLWDYVFGLVIRHVI